jgi:hypothetical protein
VHAAEEEVEYENNVYIEHGGARKNALYWWGILKLGAINSRREVV